MSEQKKYYRIYNGINKTASMVEAHDLLKLQGEKSLFISTSYYNEEQYIQFKKTNSVAGMRGQKTDQLWFDFDSKEDVNLAKIDATKLVNKLRNSGFGLNNLDIFFSASKGFHVVAKLKTELSAGQVKKIAAKLGVDLPTMDTVVYDENRILRGPNTLHEKTSLYKIPLTVDELSKLSLEEIRELAKEPRFIDSVTPGMELPKAFLVEEEPVKEVKLSLPTDENDPLMISQIDFTSIPRGWKDYKWSLAQGRFEIGKRNFSLMVIASTCRALKYGKDMTRAFCETADRLHCEITNDTELGESTLEREVLGVVFSPTWHGGQYSVENNIELQRYCAKYGFKIEKDDSTSLIGLTDINDQFKHFVKHIDENTIKTGIKQLDEAIPITVGLNLALLGAPSSGKTSIALEILKNTSMSGVVSVIASLDMHRTRLYEKVLYKVAHEVYGRNINRKELYEMYQSDKDSDLAKEVTRQFGNVFFYDRSSPTVSDLRSFILSVEAQTGKKVKLLMIDYFERIGSHISDATASSLKVANDLQDLLNDLNLAIVTLVQPNKSSLQGGPDSPILNYSSIKGSSFLSQSFRGIISLWRPFFTPKTKNLDKFMEIAILKNDLGELDHFKFNWDGKTGTISETNSEDIELYEEYLVKKGELLAPQYEPGKLPFGNIRKD